MDTQSSSLYTLWVAICVNGHLTILPQSLYTGMASEILKEDFPSIIDIGTFNTCFQIFTFMNELMQTQSGVDDFKKLFLVFFKKL